MKPRKLEQMPLSSPTQESGQECQVSLELQQDERLSGNSSESHGQLHPPVRVIDKGLGGF